MLSAVSAFGRDCFAATTEKNEGPFVCPECRKPLVLRKGTVVVHHFAHKPPVDCAYGTGETMEHMWAKYLIHDYLSKSPRITKLDVEKTIQQNELKARPDVRCVVDNRYALGIEFQKSSLDPRQIEQRTATYHQLNVYVLWLVPWPSNLVEGERYQPRETERYLHSLYFGRIFFWKRHAGIVPVTFEKYMVDVPAREWYIAGGGGAMNSAGGYEYASKKWVTPRTSNPLNILDLSPVDRSAFQMDRRSLPSARLWSIPYGR